MTYYEFRLNGIWHGNQMKKPLIDKVKQINDSLHYFGVIVVGALMQSVIKECNETEKGVIVYFRKLFLHQF